MAQPEGERAQTVNPPLLGRFGPGAHLMGKLERARDTRGTVRRLWEYLRPYRGTLLGTGALVTGTSALNALGPYLLTRAIDRYVVPGNLGGLARISLLMLGVYLTSAMLTWLQTYLMAGAAQRAVRDIRNDLFAKLQSLPLSFFDQRAHGDLMSRLTNDVENVNQILADGIVQIVSGILGLISIAAVMLAMNWRLGAVSLLAVSLTSLVLNRWIAPRLRSGFRRQQMSLGALNGLIEETVTGAAGGEGFLPGAAGDPAIRRCQR